MGGLNSWVDEHAETNDFKIFTNKTSEVDSGQVFRNCAGRIGCLLWLCDVYHIRAQDNWQ